jgi:hypothetical protein
MNWKRCRRKCSRPDLRNYTDVSEEYVASIFRVEEKAKKETSMKEAV